jgi:phospholipase C
MTLARIEHLVIVIMENRSFDHMLGYLSLPAPLGRGREVEGLRGGEVNYIPAGDTTGTPYPSHPLGRTVFRECPRHNFDPTALQIGDDRRMQGFAEDFERLRQRIRTEYGREPREDIGAVMGYHTADEVPVYDFLAEHFAVFDRWFSSVPGPTWPNRAFLYAGTSNGLFNNKRADEPRDAYRARLPRRLLVHELDRAGVEFRVYRAGLVPWLRMLPAFLELEDGDDDDEPAPAGDASRRERRRERREDRRDDRRRKRRRCVEPLRHFDRDCRRGRLAPVVFIDPNFNVRAKSMLGSHRNSDDQPPCDVSLGQRLVGEVYESIRQAGLFDRTLLLVVYDEHGGFYDHVTPPDVPARARETFPGDAEATANLSRYGVRVPVLAASGLIPPGTVISQDHDHASLARTVLLRFCAANGVVPSLGPRVDHARDLGAALRAVRPRTDLPSAREAIEAARRVRATELPTIDLGDDSLGPEIEALGLLERAAGDEDDAG